MTDVKTVKEPLFHIVKRDALPTWKAVLLRAVAIFIGFVIGAIFFAIIFGSDPFTFIGKIFEGAFGTERRIWNLLKETALLLGVGLALLPAFKMKFWNLGGNGQILIGGLAAAMCMFYLGGSMPDAVVIIFMIIASIVAGAIWGVIPAILKAKWNTNETLFTLMMNYIAIGLVELFISIWAKDGSGTLKPSHLHNIELPKIYNNQVLTILLIAIVTVLIFVYLKYSKHGYELSVVGESQNTARYAGINVKKVIIRTMVLSGAICGLIGLLLVGAISNTISSATANNMGFTSIMVVWLAKFNPLMMILTAFFIAFVSRGMSNVQLAFNITNNSVSDIVVAIMYFLILACEFFASYRVIFRKKKEKPITNDFMATEPETDKTEAVNEVETAAEKPKDRKTSAKKNVKEDK